MHNAWVQSLASPDRRPIHEWARCLDLQKPYTLTGFFNVNISRHFIEPFNALQNDRTREVNIRKPVRSGGSLIGDIWFLWCMRNDPDPFLNAFQKDDIAESHWKQRLEKLCKQLRLLPSFQGRLPWHELPLVTGATSYVSGPSINNLQSRAIRYIRLDELWLYDRGMIGEAEARTGDFKKLGNSKLCVISQGGPKPGRMLEEDDWHNHYYGGDAEDNQWEAACLSCGQYMLPRFFLQRDDGKFAGIKWDKEESNGKLNRRRALETVRFECPHCGHAHQDNAHTKSEWNRTGRYRLITPENIRKRGFHWQAVIDNPWHELVDLWLDACEAFKAGNIEAKIQFRQKYCAEDCDEKTALESEANLTRVKYEVTSGKLDGEKGRCLSVDKQAEDQYWWSVRVWFENGRSRRLGFGSTYGVESLEELRKKFDVHPVHVFIDSAYQPKGDRGVYAACVRYGWIAVRGDNTHYFVSPGKRGAIQRSYSQPVWADPELGTSKAYGGKRARLIRFSKPVYNRRVQQLIDAGLWEEPVWGNDADEKEYQRQMAGRIERTRYNRRTNEEEKFWWEGKNDHARDLANQQVLFAVLLGILPDTLESGKEQKK